jgi:hypothetical protein
MSKPELETPDHNARSKFPSQLMISFYEKLIRKWAGDRYNQLLLLLIIFFVGRPIWQVTKFGTLLYTATILLILLTLISSDLFSRRARWAFFCLSGLAFITQIPGFPLPQSIQVGSQSLLGITGLLINSGFLGVSAYLIAKALFLQKQVTGDTLKGGICAYFLLGIFWATLYQIIYRIDPTAFQVTCDGCSLDLFYFSFTTLTTLGYGDTIPVSTWARSLTNLEAIVGLMYPAIYIARLVTLYDRTDD